MHRHFTIGLYLEKVSTYCSTNAITHLRSSQNSNSYDLSITKLSDHFQHFGFIDVCTFFENSSSMGFQNCFCFLSFSELYIYRIIRVQSLGSPVVSFKNICFNIVLSKDAHWNTELIY